MINSQNLLVRLLVTGVVGANVIGAPGAAQAAASCLRDANFPIPAYGGDIYNASDIGIGVVHLADGKCTHGTYDTILQPGRYTESDIGWTEVAGAYIGAGYEADEYTSQGKIVGHKVGPGYLTHVSDGSFIKIVAWQSCC
ncbi:hypothetical protein [Paractinoplanes durhamensis]|uniref:Secreted protein n=1 Tax=Paractinoplanes durhamensis TaxID=113563 RepID=A0ABQ3YWC8_9ACTN|nr:hypothetical protein [Actinoplanes durhamensis]GIE01837.1 hypothetical protein Adu01nite_31870 [Actinoplanes durhamensis]